MHQNRLDLISILDSVSIGLAKKLTIEQSDCFTFHDGLLTTFNDDIMAQTASPFDFDVAVNGEDFLTILNKMPDEVVDVYLDGNELIIKGKRRTAGIAAYSDIVAAFDSIPKPCAYTPLDAEVLKMAQMAAKVCSNDLSDYLTTSVHVTPDTIEACDNHRLLRGLIKTGLPERLLPGSSVLKLNKLKFNGAAAAVADGWMYIKDNKVTTAIRTSSEEYYSGMDSILDMPEAKTIQLPKKLGEIVDRARTFDSGEGICSRVNVKIMNDMIQVESRKETGWYREKKVISYSGDPICFDVSPQLLIELLQLEHTAQIEKHKMKVTTRTESGHDVVFVVSLFDYASM